MSKCRYAIKPLNCEVAGSEPLGLSAAVPSWPNRCGNNSRPESDSYRHHVASERRGRSQACRRLCESRASRRARIDLPVKAGWLGLTGATHRNRSGQASKPTCRPEGKRNLRLFSRLTSVNKAGENDYETFNNRISCGLCAVQHFGTRAKRQRFSRWKLSCGRHRSERHSDRLVNERSYCGERAWVVDHRSGHEPKQYPEPIR